MMILGYHRVTPEPRGDLSVTSEVFRRQLVYLLERGYSNVRLEDMIGASFRSSRRSFAITFDDGYRDNYLHAMPILRELGLSAMLFVAVEYVGADRPYPWDEQRRIEWGDIREEDLPVTWAQLEEMQGGGLFTVGSHTLSHPELPTVDTATARREITVSKHVLEERLKRPVTAFCYPRGKLNRRIIAMVGEAGYACGVVTPERPVPRSPYTCRRIGIDARHSERQFALKVSPLFRLALASGIWPLVRGIRTSTRALPGATSIPSRPCNE